LANTPTQTVLLGGFTIVLKLFYVCRQLLKILFVQTELQLLWNNT